MPALPPGHLNDVGQVIVRLPVPSCVMNQFTVCPSPGLDTVGALVTFAVNVVAKTFDCEASNVSAVAEKATAAGVVCTPAVCVSTAETVFAVFRKPRTAPDVPVGTPTFVLAPEAVPAPVPPAATATVPPSVIFPADVIGELDTVRPVEPGRSPTDVTDPEFVAEIVTVPEPLTTAMPEPAVNVFAE